MPTSFNGTTVLDSWVTLQQVSVALLSVVAIGLGLLVILVLYSPQKMSTGTNIRELGGFSVLTAWPFFRKRHEFLMENFARTGENMFTFKVYRHSVTAMKGEAARKAFFDNKDLNSVEGYKLLMGGAPQLSNIQETPQRTQILGWFNKHIALLTNRQRLTEVLPTLFDDVQARMEGWGKEGRMDPFKDIYDLVFQMTVRMATCRELATDLDALTTLQADYCTLEKSATPTALLLPWLPSRAKKNKEVATKSLFTMLQGYVEKRRKAEVPSADAIDLLLAQGLSTEDIIEFSSLVIFAGVQNTGMNSCWALLFLSFHKDWKEKVTAEVRSLVETHTNTTSSEPLHKRLAAIPVAVWQDAMPMLDLVIRETIRLAVNSTTLRRNMGLDLHIAGTGKTLPRGNFAAYPMSDVHMNPEIYTRPGEFDPTRFGPGREEDRREAYGYIGWGAGRHPCVGMKVAKLEMKIIIALFLAGYKYDVVDAAGNFPERLPMPDFNDIYQAHPVGDSCFIKFKRMVE